MGLSGGVIGGIVGGILGGFAILGALIFCLLRRPKQSNLASASDTAPPAYPESETIDEQKGEKGQPGYASYEPPVTPALRYTEDNGEAAYSGPAGGRTSRAY
jgi:hypothetical protein